MDEFHIFIVGFEYCERISKEELENRIKESYYGSDAIFLSDMPTDRDPAYWGENRYIIIEGNLI